MSGKLGCRTAMDGEDTGVFKISKITIHFSFLKV